MNYTRSPDLEPGWWADPTHLFTFAPPYNIASASPSIDRSILARSLLCNLRRNDEAAKEVGGLRPSKEKQAYSNPARSPAFFLIGPAIPTCQHLDSSWVFVLRPRNPKSRSDNDHDRQRNPQTDDIPHDQPMPTERPPHDTGGVRRTWRRVVDSARNLVTWISHRLRTTSLRTPGETLVVTPS